MIKDFNLIKNVFKKNNLPHPLKITLFTSGQVNHVYDIDNKYVIKIEGQLEYARGLFSFQVELSDILLNKGARLPRIINAGKVDGKEYLLMEKISGKSLVYDWLKFSNKQKENFFAELAEQLKIFHSIKSDKYNIEIYLNKKYKNLRDAIENVIDFKCIDKDKLEKTYQEDLELLEKYYNQNLKILDETDTAVFVHNDIHFENIFYENDRITGIIDFDWGGYAPRDYELKKIIDFFYNPTNYVEDEMQVRYKGEKLKNEMIWLKKYYPELFSNDNLCDRLKLYYLGHVIFIFREYLTGRWSKNAVKEIHQKINDFYRHNWLEKSIFNNL